MDSNFPSFGFPKIDMSFGMSLGRALGFGGQPIGRVFIGMAESMSRSKQGIDNLSRGVGGIARLLASAQRTPPSVARGGEIEGDPADKTKLPGDVFAMEFNRTLRFLQGGPFNQTATILNAIGRLFGSGSAGRAKPGPAGEPQTANLVPRSPIAAITGAAQHLRQIDGASRAILHRLDRPFNVLIARAPETVRATLVSPERPRLALARPEIIEAAEARPRLPPQAKPLAPQRPALALPPPPKQDVPQMPTWKLRQQMIDRQEMLFDRSRKSPVDVPQLPTIARGSTALGPPLPPPSTAVASGGGVPPRGRVPAVGGGGFMPPTVPPPPKLPAVPSPAGGEPDPTGGGLLSGLFGALKAIPFGKVALAATAVVGSLTAAAYAAYQFAKSLKDVSPHLARIFAMSEVREMMRGMRIGQAIAPSTEKLEQALGDLRDAWEPFLIQGVNALNKLATFAVQLLKDLFKVLGNIYEVALQALDMTIGKATGTDVFQKLLDEFRKMRAEANKDLRIEDAPLNAWLKNMARGAMIQPKPRHL